MDPWLPRHSTLPTPEGEGSLSSIGMSEMLEDISTDFDWEFDQSEYCLSLLYRFLSNVVLEVR